MSRVQTLVQLTDDLVARLDEAAVERGTSRSAVVRAAVEEHLAVSRRARVDAEILAGYAREPQGEEEAGAGEADRRRAWADLEW